MCVRTAHTILTTHRTHAQGPVVLSALPVCLCTCFCTHFCGSCPNSNDEFVQKLKKVIFYTKFTHKVREHLGSFVAFCKTARNRNVRNMYAQTKSAFCCSILTNTRTGALLRFRTNTVNTGKRTIPLHAKPHHHHHHIFTVHHPWQPTTLGGIRRGGGGDYDEEIICNLPQDGDTRTQTHAQSRSHRRTLSDRFGQKIDCVERKRKKTLNSCTRTHSVRPHTTLPADNNQTRTALSSIEQPTHARKQTRTHTYICPPNSGGNRRKQEVSFIFRHTPRTLTHTHKDTLKNTFHTRCGRKEDAGRLIFPLDISRNRPAEQFRFFLPDYHRNDRKP